VPNSLIDGIIEKGVKNLILISNDAGDPGLTMRWHEVLTV
jgi:acyl CoA:acetate/3-ketoacid CoA transferase alpha subunit